MDYAGYIERWFLEVGRPPQSSVVAVILQRNYGRGARWLLVHCPPHDVYGFRRVFSASRLRTILKLFYGNALKSFCIRPSGHLIVTYEIDDGYIEPVESRHVWEPCDPFAKPCDSCINYEDGWCLLMDTEAPSRACPSYTPRRRKAQAFLEA